MRVWTAGEVQESFQRTCPTGYWLVLGSSGGFRDPALLHFVQERLVADLEIGGCLAAVPAELRQRLIDGLALGFHRGVPREHLEVDPISLDRLVFDQLIVGVDRR